MKQKQYYGSEYKPADNLVTAATLTPWWELTKPRITMLVLVTAYAGLWLAAEGMPPFGLTMITLLGTAMAASSSSVLNNVIDRKIDALMERTAKRPLPSGQISPQAALVFGLLLGFASFALLWWQVNLLTAALAAGTIAFYVLIYTAWLKRTTVWCTAIGGIAGATPPLIGWAAVRNDLGAPVLALFAFMYLWQPPHFWALGVMRVKEYAAAGIPILPVVRGARVTQRKMMLYTLGLLPLTLSFWFFGLAGNLYFVVAMLMGLWYIAETVRFMRRPVSPESARRLFFFSIKYLTIMFVTSMIDFVPWSGGPLW